MSHNLQTRQVIECTAGQTAIGPHETFLLNPGQIYTVFCPHENAVKVRVQTTDTVWYKMDGSNPGVNDGFEFGSKGFMAKTLEAKDMIVCGSNFKLVTYKNGVYLQAQWLGFSIS